MRDRLIKLLRGSSRYIEEQEIIIKTIADHLLESGVIVPPYAVGQEVYVVADDLIWRGGILKVWYAKDEAYERFHFDILFSDGVETISEKNIFLSEAEAKYALKNRRSVSLVNGHIEE